MKPLALTVLVHEGPMARAYLGVLQAAGYRVERIVLMVGRRDPANGQLIAPWLPTWFRRPLARLVQDLRMNHWPRELLRRHAGMCHPWIETLARNWGLEASVYDCLTERANYTRYTDQVDEVFVDGLADAFLEEHLRGLPGRQVVLFTGGGMVPTNLLNIPQCRFIHVHPGVLPNVRGADGLLWSVLLRGRPGATAFYMSPGLDTGDIILSSELDIPPMPKDFTVLDTATAYRLLYAFVDPLLRAVMLRRVVENSSGDLFALPAVAQSTDQGATFHFMHERMRRFTFERLSALSAASWRAEPADA